MRVDIRKIKEDEIEDYVSLIKDVFDFFIAADYSEKGVQFFYDYIGANNIHQHYLNSKKYTQFGAFVDNKIVGAIESRNKNHISLLFVDRKYHKLGIAKALVHNMFKNYDGDITVNSSPYAISIYERLGFEKLSGELIKDGVTYVPMIKEIDTEYR